MRRFAVWALALAFVGIVGHGSTAAQTPPSTTLSFATLAPPGSTWMRVYDSWAREVRRRSNQTLALRFYSGGVQGDEAEVIRKIRNGRIDGAGVTSVGLAQVYRPALVFQMPGILRSYEQLDRARDGMRADMDTGFAGAGFRLLGWADVGQARLFSTVAIHVPGDLATRKPFAWRDDSVLPTLYTLVRSNPVRLQLPEVLGALQTNRVDTLITPPVPCVQLQWCSRLTHMMDMPLSIVLGGTLMSKAKWDALTPENQVILRETGEQFHALARRNLRNDERTALTTITSRGIIADPITPAQKAEWEALGGRVRAALTGQIADAALINRVAAFGR
jgi:TRAP-type C4-dicarboxylate transport system substrate-binding protein